MSDIIINGKMFKDGETIGKCGTCVEESPTWCDGCDEHQTAEAVAPLNDLLCDNDQGGMKEKAYTYRDMVAAFAAGRRHMKECGNTNNDCWDFATWCYENYGT